MVLERPALRVVLGGGDLEAKLRDLARLLGAGLRELERLPGV